MLSYEKRLTWLVCVTLMGLGCSVWLDIDRRQCSSDSDCAGKGEAYEGSVCEQGFCTLIPDPCEGADDETCGDASAWTCIDAAEPNLEAAEVSLQLIDLAQDPLVGVQATLCWALDAECGNPESQVVSDDDGIVRVTLPAKFEGFLTLTSSEFYPVLFFLPKYFDPGRPLPPIAIPRPEEGEALARILNAPVNPKNGTLLIASRSCNGDAPGGLQFSYLNEDPDATPFYMDGQPVPDLDATVAGDGRGGFANTRAGAVTVVVKLKMTGEELARLPVFVRAGHLSMASLAY